MVNTFPSWEAYARYLADERAREARLAALRAQLCEHGRTMVQSCDACAAEVNA